MFDIVMITYGEAEVEERFKSLQERFPWRVLRVDGVDGIWEAHWEAARIARTKWFFVVDGDNNVYPTFNFEFEPYEEDEDWVYVWKCYNPVIENAYGHSGIKLFNRRHILRYVGQEKMDFTTTIAGKFTLIDEIVSSTSYWEDDFAIYRTAFRESAKLWIEVSDTQALIAKYLWWTNSNDTYDPNGYSRDGHVDGISFARQNIDDPEQLLKINDYAWLREEFERRIKKWE